MKITYISTLHTDESILVGPDKADINKISADSWAAKLDVPEEGCLKKHPDKSIHLA
jgi:hypothetical protein